VPVATAAASNPSLPLSRTNCTVSASNSSENPRRFLARIAKMEAGAPTVSLDLLIRTLLALSASGRDLGTLIAKHAARHAA